MQTYGRRQDRLRILHAGLHVIDWLRNLFDPFTCLVDDPRNLSSNASNALGQRAKFLLAIKNLERFADLFDVFRTFLDFINLALELLGEVINLLRVAPEVHVTIDVDRVVRFLESDVAP